MNKQHIPCILLLAIITNMHAATIGIDWRALVPSMQTAKSFGTICKQWATDNPGKAITLGAVAGAGVGTFAGYWLSRMRTHAQQPQASALPITSTPIHVLTAPTRERNDPVSRLRNETMSTTNQDYMSGLLAQDNASFKQTLIAMYASLAQVPKDSLPLAVEHTAQLFNDATNASHTQISSESIEHVERLNALTTLAEAMSPDTVSNQRLLINQINLLLNSNFQQYKSKKSYNVMARIREMEKTFALTDALEQIAHIFNWIRNNNAVLQKIDSGLATTMRQNRTIGPYNDEKWQRANTSDNQAIYRKILLALCAITRTTVPLEYQPVIRALLDPVQQNALDSTRDDKNDMIVYSQSKTIARGLAIASRSNLPTEEGGYIDGPDYARDQYNLFEQLFQKRTVSQIQGAQVQLIDVVSKIDPNAMMFDLFKINLQAAWARFNQSRQQTPISSAIEQAMRALTNQIEDIDLELLKTDFTSVMESMMDDYRSSYQGTYSSRRMIADEFVKFITAIRTPKKQKDFVSLVKQTLKNLPRNHSYQVEVYNDIATKFNNIVAEPLHIHEIMLRVANDGASSSSSRAIGDSDDE